MNREQFLKFIEYFGDNTQKGGDSNLLKFRIVHDYLSSSDCWKEFGFNNSVNLVIQKDELIRKISSGEKILLLQENTIDKWFDIEELNRKGFAVYILPNLAHRKADLNKAYSHVWDFDCGKEIYDVQTEEEAKQLVAALKQRTDIEAESVNIKAMKRKKLPFAITAYRTEDEIFRLKQQFLEKHRENLEHCLINSSPNGFRGFYFYETPQMYNQEEYEAIQQGIIATMDVDASFKQGAQPVRVSGFLHNKRKPSLVETIQYPSGFVTMPEMVNRFVSEEKCEGQPVTHKGPAKSQKNSVVVKKQSVEYQKEMIFIDAIDFIKQQDITQKYPDFSYTENFSCVFHNDNTPSARLGVYKGHHLYGCFSDKCNAHLNLIDLYIELEKNGDRTKFKEAVEELAEEFGVRIVESEFYIKEATKYQRNQKWIVEMFDDGEMEERFPKLYRKFFAKVVRYKKKNQIQKVDSNGNIRWVGGTVIKDSKGNPIRLITRSRREKVLRHLSLYANARLKDINVDGNSLFWISFSHLAELMLSENADSKVIEHEKRRIFYLVKELELLGFIKQVEIEKVPKAIQNKAKKLANVVYASGKQYEKEVINFYSMNDFFEMETIINEKAIELEKRGFKNTVHRGKNAMLIHQGEEVANQLFQDERKIDDYYLKIKKKLLLQIEKELKENGYFFKKQIVKPKFKLMINHNNKYVTKKDKEKVIDMFLYGKNGIIQEYGLEEKKLTKRVVDELKIDHKVYEEFKLQYIYIKRG